jgi:prepilin-type N-terminal cleavage/methylation domain-containing protein
MGHRTPKTTSGIGSNQMQRRHGFTLIELSIAVFIIAIIVAVAVPSFVRSFNNQLLSETARTFATTCQLARVQAVTRQVPATLHMDLERQMFWVTQPVKTETGDSAGEDQTLKVYELPRQIAMASVERVDGAQGHDKLVDLTFYPNGTCDSATVLFRGSERRGLVTTVDPMTCQAIPYLVK